MNKDIIKIKIPNNFLFQDKKNILELKNIINKNKELKIFTKRRNLNPILSTHYLRSYFLSSDKRLRLTVDRNLEYINLANNKDINLKLSSRNIILELKYPKDFDDFVKNKIRDISVRVSKNSKYIDAASLLKII